MNSLGRDISDTSSNSNGVDGFDLRVMSNWLDARENDAEIDAAARQYVKKFLAK